MAGKGLFIVLEGIDGSGKDTHLKFLAKELRELGYAVVETAEPSRDRVGTFLKRYAKRKTRTWTGFLVDSQNTFMIDFSSL